MVIIWIIVFFFSLIVLVKGADWLLNSAEKIGLAMGLSPFIIGVTIVGLGTSFPELVSSFAAIFQGAGEIVVANATGSNIANILLIVGLSAVISKSLVVTKSLIDLDLPLLAISTVIFLGVAMDGQITFFESLLLVATYVIYLFYTILHTEDTVEKPVLLKKIDHSNNNKTANKTVKHPKEKVGIKEYLWLVVGIVSLVIGAHYLIESVIQLSLILNIAVGAIAISAVAFGTSLPELLVSARAALRKKSEVALGNIFGSNVFNILVVTGLPGLFVTLPLDEPTFTIGVPALAAATFLFIISGISRRIHAWEGALYLVLYVVFVGKIFSLF